MRGPQPCSQPPWDAGDGIPGLRQTRFSSPALPHLPRQLPTAPDLTHSGESGGLFFFLPQSLGMFVFLVISVVFFQNGPSDGL